MSQVAIKYVGKKPIAFDNVAGSKKAWNGNGDVQEVTDIQARALLKHPDQWALADKADKKEVEKPVVHETTDGEGNKVDVAAADLKKPIERMNKSELTVYAKEKFGKDLDQALSKKQMIDQIEEFAKNGDGNDLV